MMRARALLVLPACIVAIVVGLPSIASAQRAAPTIQTTATFDPPSASIGDRVTLSVRVTHPDDIVVRVTPPNIADVEVVNAAPNTIVLANDGTRTTTYGYTLQPFVLGTVDTGTLRISWLRSDGSAGTLDAPGAQLVIAPVRAANDQALRPLKPQLDVGGAPPAWLRPSLAATVALAVVLVLLVLVRIALRFRPRHVEVTPPPDTSPEGVARHALDALGVRGLPRIDYPSYYGGLAVTVRTYLAARFGFNAHALTTRELEHRMVAHGVDRWQARLVGGLLERCDDAVYARRYPDPASADHDLTVAYEIVELSRPRAVEGPAVPA